MNIGKSESWSEKKTFITFLCIHFIVWSIVPLMRSTLSMDTLEAVLWGKLNDWGTNKHPPLSGWIANISFIASNGQDFGLYVINQILILIGFIYIYKLARLFLDTPKAILAVMLLEGVGRYTRSTYEFTDNMVSLALWPMAVYYFYKSMKEENIKFWILFGIAIGLNLLNKYMTGVILISMGLFVLSSPQNRSQLKKSGIYIAALVALAILTPHIIWLYKNDWFSLYYFIGDRLTSANKFGIFGHIAYPIIFLFTIMLLTIPTIIAFTILRHNSEKEPKNIVKTDAVFILLMGVLPTLLFASIGLLTGHEIKHTWGFPLYYMLGIILFYFFPFKLSKHIFSKAVIIVYILMSLMVCNKTYQAYDRIHLISDFDRASFLSKMEKIWDEETNNSPIRYVDGNLFLMSNLSLYGKYKPHSILPTHGFANPWVNMDDVKKTGLLEVNKYPQDGYKSFDIYMTNFFGKTEPFTVYYKITKGIDE